MTNRSTHRVTEGTLVLNVTEEGTILDLFTDGEPVGTFAKTWEEWAEYIRTPTEVHARATFVAADVIDASDPDLGIDESVVEDWLSDNAKHIEEAMVRAGYEAIEALLALDPIG